MEWVKCSLVEMCQGAFLFIPLCLPSLGSSVLAHFLCCFFFFAITCRILEHHDGVLDQSYFASLFLWLFQRNETIRAFPNSILESAKEYDRRGSGKNLPRMDLLLPFNSVSSVFSHRSAEIQTRNYNRGADLFGHENPFDLGRWSLSDAVHAVRLWSSYWS